MSDGPDDNGKAEGMTPQSQWHNRAPRKPAAETGFDAWLTRSLNGIYGDVANEPLPPALLELIRRNTQKGG
ncbi:hypothetical protein [Roseococcus sp. YIM B11640]|uniref:hypothetical protein n=1 Tax=Roseococcus sp. YIM B11640 TaxID=3133973 RepID=UPI003C7EAEEF